jgi:hypothetical protein
MASSVARSLCFRSSGALVILASLGAGIYFLAEKGKSVPQETDASVIPQLNYKPRKTIDTSGYITITRFLPQWRASASLEEVGAVWKKCEEDTIARLEATQESSSEFQISRLIVRTGLMNYRGDSRKGYDLLREARRIAEQDSVLAEEWLFTIIYYQGIVSLRRGEDDNCILCRGESSCILPLAPAAIHANPAGSRDAIRHFREYLQQFPDDLGARWLLNLAHMTVGEYPDHVDPRFLISLERWQKSEYDIGKFRDIGHIVGVNRFNQAGGAIMDDFDNDGLLDIVTSSFDPNQSMALFRNRGDGTFEDRTQAAGLAGQLGGLYCVQTDYDNDGFLDIFVPRGAWAGSPVRPSLLHNNGNGTFTDVTKQAGLDTPINSISACWADYDNDGFLDLFVCCESQPNRLYRNRGNGTFEEIAVRAGVAGNGTTSKGANWIDYDNDGYPDLFVNNLGGTAVLYHNNRNGTFTDVTAKMGIDGPKQGFSCWAWDYDNDGWLDIFATSYDRSLDDAVRGLLGEPHQRNMSRLYRNMGGQRFQDVTREAGLDMVFMTMGSNFGDFDNDGYLDMYLGTGDPSLHSLVPNRMFKNVAGKRFAEITASSGTGHLQKGHAVACGDWDRNGTLDIFIETGGAIPGDRYHDVLFQNPGQGNNWLTVKLVGVKSNRPGVGARIKVVTEGADPLTIHRHVSSGSSFGGNPFEQTIGLGRSKKVALLEIHWPTSGETQVFKDIEVDQMIEVTEFAKEYKKKNVKPIALRK